jgi:phosphatidylserine/phosphatidylglycerophosphate/cardiolipin synthase-like enzyme
MLSNQNTNHFQLRWSVVNHTAVRSCLLFSVASIEYIHGTFAALDKGDVYTPQNEAWLSALRNAEREVFIQTPDLNADPLVPAIMAACRRGIKVTCYVCLGYNDAVRSSRALV